MGIFKRVQLITKANIHGLLDKAEDPIAMLNEMTREIEQEIAHAQKALSFQIYAENKQKALISDINATIEKRMRQAKLAIAHGDELIARLALEEKTIQEHQLNLYVKQLEVLQEQTNLLKNHLSDFHALVTEIQNRKIVLASRANVAKSVKRLQTAISSFETGDILEVIEKAEDQILLMEAEVQAGQHFASPLSRQETIYQSVMDKEEINQELDKLKQTQIKMG